MGRACIFDGQRPITEEHVIPLWVHPYLPGTGDMLTYERAGRTWESDELLLTTRRVCKRCNEGWMSDLESRAKPLVVGPIQHQPAVWGPLDQQTVASWAYKTALMCGLSGTSSHVPKPDFRYLRNNLSPPGRIRIWATLHAPRAGATDFQVAVIENRGLLLRGRQGSRLKGYAITVGIGHLAFQVFGYDSGTQLTIERPMLGGVSASDYEVAIWPIHLKPVTWPARRGFDREGLIAYSRRFES